MDNSTDSDTAAATGADRWRIKPSPRSPLPANEIGGKRALTNGQIIGIVLAATTLIILSIVALSLYLDNSNAPSELEQKGRDYVASVVRDPSSLQFQSVAVSGQCITGQFNAKNAFGGYVGFKDFYYDDARGVGQVQPEGGLVLTGDDKLQALVTDTDFRFAYSDCQAHKLRDR
jgi:hypothetical protein